MQTRRPTRLPVGVSVRQMIFESAPGAFASADLAVAETPAVAEVAIVEATAAVEDVVLGAATAMGTWDAATEPTGVPVVGAAITAVDFAAGG